MEIVGIDRKAPKKLYCQLSAILRAPIAAGEWKVGTQIPTEQQLAAHYGVSKTTVRLAVEELVALGILKKLQGKGTFVRRSVPETCLRMATDLNAGFAQCGSAQALRVLENRMRTPAPEIADQLHLAEGEFCWHFSRVRVLGRKPQLLERLYLPYALCSGVVAEPAATASLPQCVEERSGARIQRMREQTDVLQAGAEEAEALEVPPQTPALRTQQVYFQSGDRPVGCRELWQPADAWGRTVEFERL